MNDEPLNISTKGMLSPYRVLDLTDEKGLFCGKLLGDLGAEVIKIEEPGGDAARNRGPFYHDEPDPEKSLFWFAFNTSKKGITLKLDSEEGQRIFKRLVENTDFVLECFPPGYLGTLGLGYTDLEKINPKLIMISITPFGQTGPYKDYRAPDIVAWAMGGKMHPIGDPDRPPVRTSHHSQSYLHAGTDGAIGAMMALYQRQITGEGQQVDVSTQGSLPGSTYGITAFYDMTGQSIHRGELSGGIAINPRQTWTCQDGYVMWIFTAGLAGMQLNPPLVKWMKAEAFHDEFLMTFDWAMWEYETADQETLDRLEAPAARFFGTRTKGELLAGAVKHRVTLYPIATTKDLLESVQLASRQFWEVVNHPELGTTLTYPGGFARSTEAPPRISSRAPLIGEHNREIFEKELGISAEKLVELKQKGVI